MAKEFYNFASEKMLNDIRIFLMGRHNVADEETINWNLTSWSEKRVGIEQ